MVEEHGYRLLQIDGWDCIFVKESVLKLLNLPPAGVSVHDAYYLRPSALHKWAITNDELGFSTWAAEVALITATDKMTANEKGFFLNRFWGEAIKDNTPFTLMIQVAIDVEREQPIESELKRIN
jgi:hypothetical protein